MKKILVILCLLVFALPCFATGTYKKGCNDNITYTGTTASHEYYQKLVKNYEKKYPLKKINDAEYETTSPPFAWQNEVEHPLIKFMCKESRQQH